MKLHAAGVSVGKGRPGSKADNQDAMILDEFPDLVAVFDGLGGHSDGDLASHIARESMVDWKRKLDMDERDGSKIVDPTEALDSYRRALWEAHEDMISYSRKQIEALGGLEAAEKQHYLPMGTTATALWTPSGLRVYSGKDRRRFARGIVAHVGDSRLARIDLRNRYPPRNDWDRREDILTQTHTFGGTGLVCRALGAMNTIHRCDIDVFTTEVIQDYLYILSTDGFHTFMLYDYDVLRGIWERGDDLTAICDFLVDIAYQVTDDDLTVIVMRPDFRDEQPPSAS